MFLRRLWNRFSRLSAVPALLGVGMALLGGFLPNTGWSWVTTTLAQSISIVGFCFLAGAVSLIIVGFIKTPSTTTLLKESKYQRLYEIIPTLRKMDRYLWSIADNYTIRNINMQKFQQLGTKSKTLLHMKTVKLDPKKSLNDWLKKSKQVFSRNEKAIKEQLASSDLEQINKMMVAQTRLIDDEGYGLKEEKLKDKKYNKFKKNIEKYHDENKDLIDSWISYLIHFHIHMSEFFANGLLIIKCTNLVSQKTRIPMVSELAGPETQANLADLETDSNERLNEIRMQISDYIKELDSGSIPVNATNLGESMQ